MQMSDTNLVHVRDEADIVDARQVGREMAENVGIAGTDVTLVTTAISEVARNIISYATAGEIELTIVDESGRHGLRIIARDSGPGIEDVETALADGYSSADGLGLGLPGARRLMDDFEVDSAVGEGTTVTMTKWRGER